MTLPVARARATLEANRIRLWVWGLMEMEQDRVRRAEVGLRRIRWGVWVGVADIVALLLLAAASFVYEARFAVGAVETAGRVVKVAAEDKGDRVSYSFVDSAGGPRRGSAHCMRGSYRVGDGLRVLYVPGRPRARSIIAGFWNEWILTLFFGGAGVVTVFPTLWLRSRWRKMRAALDARVRELESSGG